MEFYKAININIVKPEINYNIIYNEDLCYQTKYYLVRRNVQTHLS